ncbi:hypothetical protein [Myceligenerans crystallogenes]|uniref:Uncharacterized protein n=1 Tax=Myceligenerans crystallogenes TaxID=316335 RepID=A0ABN2NB79_9MICO
MNGPEAGAGRRPSDAVTWVLAAACVVAPLSVVLAPDDAPAPFVVTLALQVAALVQIGRHIAGRLRSGIAARAGDYVTAGVPAVAAALTYGTLTLAALEYGIRGSALPRLMSGVRHGVPLATDLTYVLSVATAAAIVVASAALVVVLARHRLRAGLAEAGDAAATAAEAVRAAAGSPGRRRGLVPVTRASDGFGRRMMSPSAWVVTAVTAVLMPPGLWLLAADPQGNLMFLGFLLVFPGATVGAWVALQALWRPDEQFGHVVMALYRGMVVPVLTVPPLAVVQLVFTRLPFFADRVVAYADPEDYIPHYWFAGDEAAIDLTGGSPLTQAVMAVLGGFAFALLAAVVVAVFVVWPYLALVNPTALLTESKLSEDPAHVADNVAVTRMSSAIAILAFVIPTLMVLSESDEIGWWIGALLIPVLVVLVYRAWSRQRATGGARN